MKNSMLMFFSALLASTFVQGTEIDNKLVKCLVCRSTMKEIEGEIAKIDPSREIEIGNYRLDAQGNVVRKKVPLARSEVHMSDLLDDICEKMSDYVRATYKSNGQLTILSLVDPASGGMNPEVSKVDIVQDGDLNKSLKYYCEEIVEEHQESIISLFVRGERDVGARLCTDAAVLCDPVENDDDDDDDDDESHEEHEL